MITVFKVSVPHSFRQDLSLGKDFLKGKKLDLINLVFWGVFSPLCLGTSFLSYSQASENRRFLQIEQTPFQFFLCPCGWYVLRLIIIIISPKMGLVSLAVQLWGLVLQEAFNFLLVFLMKSIRGCSKHMAKLDSPYLGLREEMFLI